MPLSVSQIARLQQFLNTGTVVVIEPTDNYRMSIKQFLRNLKVEKTYFSTNVKEALAELALCKPSVLIVEWNQTRDLNGIQLCRQLRKDPRLKETPFLLLSVENLRKDIVLASEVGIDGYMLKPFSYEDFAEQLLFVQRTAAERNHYTSLIEQAENLLETEEYWEAEKLFIECKDYEWGTARVKCGIGRIRLAEDNVKQAIQLFLEAIDVNENYLEAYRRILDVYEGLEEPHRTLHIALKAHHLSPDNPRYMLMIAKAYLAINELKESEHFFRMTIRISPKLAEGHKGLGDVRMMNEDYDEAMKHFQKALDLDGDDVGILNSMGLLYIRQSRYEPAIKKYRLALNIEPNNPKVLFNIGHAYERLEDFKNAWHFFNRALISDPDFDKPKRGLARVQALKKVS